MYKIDFSSINRVELTGIWAWIFYLNTFIWFINVVVGFVLWTMEFILNLK